MNQFVEIPALLFLTMGALIVGLLVALVYSLHKWAIADERVKEEQSKTDEYYEVITRGLNEKLETRDRIVDYKNQIAELKKECVDWEAYAEDIEGTSKKSNWDYIDDECKTCREFFETGIPWEKYDTHYHCPECSIVF